MHTCTCVWTLHSPSSLWWSVLHTGQRLSNMHLFNSIIDRVFTITSALHLKRDKGVYTYIEKGCKSNEEVYWKGVACYWHNLLRESPIWSATTKYYFSHLFWWFFVDVFLRAFPRLAASSMISATGVAPGDDVMLGAGKLDLLQLSHYFSKLDAQLCNLQLMVT